MKSKLLLFLIFLTNATVFAQISAEEIYEGIFPKKLSSADRMDRWMVEAFHTKWIDGPENINLKIWSGGIRVGRYWDMPLDKKSRFAIAIGLSFSSQNFLSNGRIVYRIDSLNKETTVFEPFPSNYKYSSNKLSLNYVELPFQLRIRSGTKHNWFFYPGIKVGYLFNSHTKTIDDDSKFKVYRIHGLNPIQYGLTAHLGYNRLALYGYYSLSSIFLKDRGPQFQIFSVGLSLNFF